MTSLVPTLVARVSGFSNTLAHMIELRTAVVDALHGHLDNFLVNSSHISAVLHRLNVELRRMHPSLHAVFTSLTDV